MMQNRTLLHSCYLFNALSKKGERMRSSLRGFQRQFQNGGKSNMNGWREPLNPGNTGKKEVPLEVEAEDVEIDITSEVEEELDLWIKYAVIGEFIGLRFNRNQIKDWVYSNWDSKVVIKFMPKGFFTVIFTDEVRNKILIQQNWFLEECPLYLQPWQPNFNPLPLVVYNHPIWIRLYNLPLDYWNDSCLEKIGRSLGTLIDIDNGIMESDSYLYARLKIAVVKKIPSKLSLLSGDNVWMQQVEVEAYQLTCGRCGLKNHQSADCRVFVKLARNAKKWVTKLNSQLTVTKANKGDVLDKTPILASKPPSPKQNCSGAHSENANKDDVRLSPSRPDPINHKGLSDNEINYDLDSEDEFHLDDELDNIDPRSISQSANILLGKAKGVKGRKSKCQKR